MSRFLVADDSDLPAEPAISENEEIYQSDDEDDLISEVYRVLRDLCERIEHAIAKG